MADLRSWPLQALEEDRLGPQRRGTYSTERQRRLAVQEGATALVCTLMPAIEPVVSVSPSLTWFWSVCVPLSASHQPTASTLRQLNT